MVFESVSKIGENACYAFLTKDSYVISTDEACDIQVDNSNICTGEKLPGHTPIGDRLSRVKDAIERSTNPQFIKAIQIISKEDQVQINFIYAGIGMYSVVKTIPPFLYCIEGTKIKKVYASIQGDDAVVDGLIWNIHEFQDKIGKDYFIDLESLREYYKNDSLEELEKIDKEITEVEATLGQLKHLKDYHGKLLGELEKSEDLGEKVELSSKEDPKPGE